MSNNQLLKKQQKINRFIKKGQLLEAIKLLNRLCQQYPSNTDLLLRLAPLYGQMGDFHSLIKVCEKVQTLQPNNPMIDSFLGNAYANLNNLDKAIEHYHQALKYQPDNPTILNNYGNTLYLSNKLEEAEEIFQRVIAIKPDYLYAHNNLGHIYKSFNNNELAITHFFQAYRLDPHNYQITINIAAMFADRIGHPEQAEKYYRKAMEIDPSKLEAMCGVTNMLRYMGRLGDALEMIHQAQEKFPHEIGMIAAEADIYERKGDYNKAFEIIKSISDQETPSAMLATVFMKICHKFNCCDEAIKMAEKITNNPSSNVDNLMDTYFGLGKLYDKQKKYDEAFDCYKAGNETKDYVFDMADFKSRINNLITSFNHDDLKKHAKSDIDTSRPIFIVGMPRSSTSLTEQILSSHPEVEGAGELNDINDIVGKLSGAIGNGISYPECVKSLTSESCNSLAQDYLHKLTSLCGNSRFVTDKMPHNFINLGLISLLFPQAKIIHCVRDPRDTCLSIYFQSFDWIHTYGSRLNWLGQYYQEYMRIMQHWENTLITPIHTVRYDEMISDQETTTRKLLDYCELEWNDACLNFHKSERVVATASYDQVRQKIYSQSQARWKKYEQHIAPLVESLGDALDEWPG